MAVLQVLTEVICPEKLLAGIAFAELVHILQMANPLLPVIVTHCSIRSAPWKFLSAVTASIRFTWSCSAVVKGTRIAREG